MERRASWRLIQAAATIAGISLLIAMGAGVTAFVSFEVALSNQTRISQQNRMDLIRTQAQRVASRYDSCQAIDAAVIHAAANPNSERAYLATSPLGNCTTYAHADDLHFGR